VDETKHRVAIVAPDGKLEWERKISSSHDLSYLKNGNVLFATSYQRILEVDPKMDKVVWEYDVGKMNGNEGKRVEVHGFQRLPNGDTMIAESGIGRIIEVDKSGKIKHEIKLKRNKPDAHRDTRLVRVLDNGNYLAAQEGDGAVREYDHKTGKVVWEYNVPLFGLKPADGHNQKSWGNQAFSAVRLKNGNTLIGTGNGHGILEVDPKGNLVWTLFQNELPGIRLAWVTTLQVLPNGNIVFGNCHAGDKYPQIIEITRDKKVVWQWKDFTRFGDATTNSQVLDVAGSIR